MDKKLLKECFGAVLEAAVEGKWDHILDMTLNDVVEQLDASEIATPEEAVGMFRESQQYMLDCEVEAAERAAGWDPNP